MTILETYIHTHARSAELHNTAGRLFPSGLTHDARHTTPFPLAIERSSGAYKWDANGNRLIDYWTGHGALLLGHGHPAVVAAVQRQMERGAHLGGEHELAIQWAALVQKLFPGLERLRFTASGTEATLLALRLARAYTRRSLVIRFAGHYHGWHDLLARDAVDAAVPPGVPTQLRDATLVLPTDLAQVERAIQHRDDIAAIILEPTGASYGAAPISPDFVRQLRQLTEEHRVLLIFDEVVTGFRVAPGGVQERLGITPDLTALAKILAGGLPGGAVGGRAAIMRHLEFGDAAWSRDQKIVHNGTFNANPLSAAAGLATLAEVAGGKPGVQAAALGAALVDKLNMVLRERGLRGWSVYGDGSIFHLIAGSRHPLAPGDDLAGLPLAELKRGGDPGLVALLRIGLINHGVDLMRGRSGFLSAAHSEQDIAATVDAFAATLDDLVAEGALA